MNEMRIFTANIWYLFISCVGVSMTICVVMGMWQGVAEFIDWLKDRYRDGKKDV